MFISEAQISRMLQTLDAVRQTFRCEAPRHDAKGSNMRHVKKPLARKGIGDLERDQVREKGIEVPYGTHGADFLIIDPETLEVVCGACAGQLDATVIE